MSSCVRIKHGRDDWIEYICLRMPLSLNDAGDRTIVPLTAIDLFTIQ